MADVEIRAAGTQAVTAANIADAMLFAMSLDPQGWGKMSPAELRTLAANAGILSGTVDPSAGLKVAGRHQLYVNRTASTLHFHSGVIADAWVSIGGGTATAITWQDEGNARAGVTTVNLVGSGVTGAVSAGVLTVTIPGTTTPVQTHTNYVGVINGALSTVTGANFTVNGITAALTIPSYSGYAASLVRDARRGGSRPVGGLSLPVWDAEHHQPDSHVYEEFVHVDAWRLSAQVVGHR